MQAESTYFVLPLSEIGCFYRDVASGNDAAIISFHKKFEDFMWAETKILIANYKSLPLLVKAEIMLHLVGYPRHLYALSIDPVVTSNAVNGIWCEIYVKRFGGRPLMPFYDKMNIMSTFAQTLSPFYQEHRRKHLSLELYKWNCELREDNMLCIFCDRVITQKPGSIMNFPKAISIFTLYVIVDHKPLRWRRPLG